ETGAYLPLQSSGTHGGSVFAFARRLNRAVAITCVPRMLTDKPAAPLGHEFWGDTSLELPASIDSCCWRDVFTGATLRTQAREGARTLNVSQIFEHFPAAILVAPA